MPGAPNRVSFAKLREPLEVPGLLDVQTDSFEWLIGSPRWREIATTRGDIKPVGGLDLSFLVVFFAAQIVVYRVLWA